MNSSDNNNNIQFEKLRPRHVPLTTKNKRSSSSSAPRKLEFAHEKFTTRTNEKTLPAWAVEARKVAAVKTAKRENAVDGKYGMTEFLYRDLTRADKVVEGMLEARYHFEARPMGTIAMSHDDCFVRSLSYDEKVEDNTNVGNVLWRVTENFMDHHDNTKVITTSADNSSSLVPVSSSSSENNRVVANQEQESTDFKNFVPQIVDTKEGFDIAPLSKEGKKKAVFVVRVLLAPGTTIEALCEGLKHKVQHARHQSPNFREDFVPCEVRLESSSNGFLCGTTGCGMEVNCRVRTWAAAHHCLMPEKETTNHKNDSNNNIFKWNLVRGGGQYCITSCWTLEEWKNNNNNNNNSTSSSSSSSSKFKQPSITEYSLLIRGSECPMNSILEPLKKIRDRGFINYSSNQYFGMPMSNSIEFARAFLEGRYTTCVLNHFLCLARTSRECTGAVFQLKRRLMTVFGGSGVDFFSSSSSIMSENEQFKQKLEAQGHSELRLSNRNQNQNNNNNQLRRNLKFEWKTFVATLETAIDNAKHVCVVTKSNNADWDLQPLHKLLELAQHIQQLDGDCAAAVIDHQLIPEVVIQWHLKSLSDLHFNTLASIRLRKFGTEKVVVGDVVCLDEDLLHKLDANGGGGGHAPNFSVPSSGALTYDRNDYGNNPLIQEFLKRNDDDADEKKKSPFKLIESASEARDYKPSSIILPKWGIVPEELSLSSSSGTIDDNNQNNNNFHNKFFNWVFTDRELSSYFPLPKSQGFDWETCATISKSLNIPPILTSSSSSSTTSSSLTRFFPQISYRPLFAKPRWLFAHCWDNRSVSGDANVGLDALLMSAPDLHVFPTDVDGEGWRRMMAVGSNSSFQYQFSSSSSTSMMISPPRMRPAVRQKEVREILKASVAAKGITTAVRIALPSGVALSSALREVFQLRVFENREIADRLAECVDIASKKTNTKLREMDRRAKRRVENGEVDSMEF